MIRLMKRSAMRSVRRFTTLPLSLLLLGGSLIFLVAPALRMWTAGAASEPAKYEIFELRYQGWTGQVLFPELAEDLGYLTPIVVIIAGAAYLYVALGQIDEHQEPRK